MNVIRYVNGHKIDAQHLKSLVVENDIIIKTIKDVNFRIKNANNSDR